MPSPDNLSVPLRHVISAKNNGNEKLTATLQINFNAVAEATNINISAARMRWTRLKARIEKEMANGSEGEPSETATPAASAVKGATPTKKRSVKRKKISEPENEDAAEDDSANDSTMQAM
ncbi:hypothetical protein BBP40_003880 [Aspergillus hancockii]|nr:hypothetical protein BBP40_003880 [Aspergillus hancockii]